MTINITNENETVILSLEGRLDTITAPLLGNALSSAFDEAKKITIDCSKLTYVSSAGLRILFTGQKTADENGILMMLTGVPEEIMEILEMTGFSDILTVE
ncbi:MAG: STAS domain-containing protein [Treponema sp.]|nr:STAS domain-containing protein [Treponema sp.]